MRQSAHLLLLVCALFAARAASGEILEPISKASYRHFGIFHLFDATFSSQIENASTDPLGDFPKSLEFVYSRKITSTQLIEAANKILPKVTDTETIGEISDRLRQLNALYQDVETGDRYTLSYTPSKGTSLSLNGTMLTSIPGSDFQAAYFSIWLSPKSPFTFKELN